MAIRIRNLDEMHELALAYARGLNPKLNTAPRSGFWFRTRAVAAIAMGANNAAAYLLRQILPSTAERDFLERHADIRGISRRSATNAVGKILVITTTPTSSSPVVNIPSGTKYTHASGRTYTVLGAATTAKPTWTGKTSAYGSTAARIVVAPDASSIADDDAFQCDGQVLTARSVLPDSGTELVVDPYYAPGPAVAVGEALSPLNAAVLLVECDETGVEGNLAPGDTLTLSGSITNLGTGAVVLEMTGGAADADDEELRSRVLAYMQERPGSGNRADYREWARQTPDVGVLDAFVYPTARGLGTVDIVCFGPSGARALGSAANALVLAHLQSRAPAHDDVLVRQLIDGPTVDLEINITPGVGYEPDWTGTVTVSTGSSALVVNCVSSSAFDSIEIGDRIVVQSTAAGRTILEQREVIGKTGTTITLDSALLAAPANLDTMWPGGPLIEPVMQAVADHFDALGPGDSASETRFPTYDESGDAVFRTAAMYRDLMSLDGVLNAEIVLPAADVTPSVFARPVLGVLTIAHV